MFSWIGADGFRLQRDIVLKSTRAGSKEMVFESLIGQMDRLKLRIGLSGKRVDLDFTFPVAGSFAQRAFENTRFFVSSMSGPGVATVVHRDTGAELISKTWEQQRDEKTIRSCELLDKFLEIERFLGKPLKVPSNWFEDDDVYGILDIYEILTKGRLDLGNCKLNIPVDYELSERMKKEVDGSGNVALRSETSEKTVAGYQLELGPCVTVVNDPTVLKDEMQNHCIEVDGMKAVPFVVNVPVRSKSGSVVQYFEKFNVTTEGSKENSDDERNQPT